MRVRKVLPMCVRAALPIPLLLGWRRGSKSGIAAVITSGFGLRISFGFRPSDFGFKTRKEIIIETALSPFSKFFYLPPYPFLSR
jgi:hypothetical protein